MKISKVGKAEGYREEFIQLIPENPADIEELYCLDSDNRGYIYGSRHPIQEFLIPLSGKIDLRIARLP